jgi:general secretion pathway protein B
MSYILDALKRADAERERGAVPGLHARQVVAPASQAAYSVQQRVWIAVAAALALAGIAAAGLWIWQTPDDSVRLAVVEPAVVNPPAPAPSAQPAPATNALPPAPQSAPAASRAALSPPLPVSAPAAIRPAPSARAIATQPQPRPQPEPVAKAAASQAAAPAVRLLGELPENMRRQIPPLVITGSVYSKNPDKRLLLVNNQVLTQGSPAAPDVNLEEIQAKSSVFSFRGTRFRVVH